MEPESLWVKVIKSIHSNQRKVEAIPFKKSLTGVWKNIGDIEKDFIKNSININTSLRSKVRIGDKTLFCGIQFPNLYQLANKKRASVLENYRILNGGRLWEWAWLSALSSTEDKQQIDNLMERLQHQVLPQNNDVWVWKNFEQQEFSVRNVKLSLGQNLDLNLPPNMFTWNNWATSKSVAFVWRAIEEKVPTAVALTGRCMNLPDVLCKTCGATEETAQHILIECNFAKRVWEAITDWLKIPMVNTERTVAEWLSELLDLQRIRKIRKVIHAVVIEAMWILWKTRNEKVFSGRQGVLQTVIEEVKEASFQEGLKQRSKYGAISRSEWWDFNLSM
ncbi:uncharacterized protein LOC110935379 [Helianthus annuus]|uniref:uncharacterized protein LOC110935379 n=1 Tax=Helianthus annuus TaxID=4232 RepID=UPI000B9067E5|nr:uncharacterized protein LOC110935379 [Helianthus annuus]